jgi:hypothetical protein
MLSRRELVGSVLPISAVSLLAGPLGQHKAWADANRQANGQALFASPPVVQHPRPNGCSVHVAVTSLVTGWVEWGTQPNRLDQTAMAHHHGLIQASDRALAFQLSLPATESPPQTVYYRIALQPLNYKRNRGHPLIVHLPVARIPVR